MPAIRIEIRGQSFDAPLPETPVRIGRRDGVDLCIQGEGIGAEHCVLEPLGGGRTKLKDLGSGYETLVNGVVAKQISLGDGDVIQVGEARITYLAHAAGAPAAAPAAEAIPGAPPPPPPPPPPPTAAKPKPAAKPKAAAKPKPAAKPKAAAKPKSPAKPKAAAKPAAPDAAKPAVADAPASAAEPAPPSDARERSSRAQKKAGVPIVGILAGVVVLVGLFFFLNAMGGHDAPSYGAEVDRGRRLFDDQDYEAARAAFEGVIRKAPEGADKIAAQEGLQLVASVEREMDAKLERLRGEGLVLTPELLRAERRRFLASYGEAQAGRFDAAQAAMLRAQERWKQDNVAATRAVADRHLEAARFVAARDAWDTLGGKAPAAIDVTAEVREAFAALESAATAKADELIQRATEWNEAGMPYRSVKLLGDMLPNFEGFTAHARLRKALATAKAESAKTPTIPDRPTRPRPDRPGTQPERPTPTDPTRPPTDAARAEALRKQADAVIAAASEHADARRFRDAAAQIMNGARQLTPGPQRVRVEGVADDFGLAAKAKDALIAHIEANPDRYANVRLAPRVRATIFDADGEYLHARVTGGTSKHAWARLSGDAWAGLLGRMKPGADEAVPAAALLHVIAREEDAERMLASAVEQGHEAEPVFARLARWRGIEVPEGGFVLYEGRYVTPAERAHLVREAQIAEALAKLDSRKPEERAEAAQALLAIGEPARERFADALSRRRAFLLDEIVRSKSYRSGKHKTKLLRLLDERRKHALALIYDAQAYPYPNPQKKNQAEVEARVDQVREVWERPFDLVSQWDKALRERIEGLTEVDTLLDQVQPGFDPNLDDLKKRINEAIDVPSSADGSSREYSLKVMVYNTTLDTTAGEQEKANVRSVNEYRMMMGLLAVKIDERLVRAARGHSRHMATNGYFAHNVPDTYATPTNRTPGSRAKQQGFGGGVGENIARGPGTGHGAFMAWFRSSGHHRNMLGKGWLVMGCGRANQTWWTQLFGGGSKSLDAPDPLPAPEAPFAPDEIDRPKARDE